MSAIRFVLMLSVVLCAFGVPGKSAACTCFYPEPFETLLAREFDAKQWVIVGEVGQPQRIATDPDRWTATLTVTEAFKGDAIKGQLLPIEIVADGTSCSNFVWRGERLLLFLDRLQVSENDYGGCLLSGPQGDSEELIEIVRRLAEAD